MIDKNCLPKEIHCVYGFITEENFASSTPQRTKPKYNLFNNVHL